MSSLSVNEDQKWVPTHVQVTVLRGRALRGKGKHGTSDVYTIIQLGKEKYSTCVAEKTTEPEWREECSFELQPGVLEGGRQSGYPAGSGELVLTVMHRALIGLDVFLGQAVIQLDKVFRESRCVKNEWYRLNSKTGKKEKERGDIQVTVQFTRNNLTASMYDLVMKDKGASTFSKLKERMRGKRRSSEEDSSSAVLPGGYGSLYRMRQRLPSDGGGEEDYEDDEGGEARRSKMRTFFLRGKLRKSSDTRSSTSLGSESSESSSRGGSLSPTAGISVVVSDLSNSPSNSSNLTADNSPEHTADISPKSSSLQCEFGDDTSEITIAVPQLTVCVNGSHAYGVQPPGPGSGKPAGPSGLGPFQKTLPLSMSLQNLGPQASTHLPTGGVGDGRRWSFDKPGDEEKAAIAAALEKSGPMQAEEDECPGQTASLKTPPSSSSSSAPPESESQGKKQRRNLFSHGKGESAGKGAPQRRDESEQAAEEKHKGWFGSKAAHSKPSLVVSPKLEPSTDPHPPPLPTSHQPSGPTVDPACLVSPLHHTNPFYHSQATPPPMSPCNPFFSLLQHNPFFDEMLAAQPLKPLPPPLPYLSSSRPPISQLFPQAGNPDPALLKGSPTAKGAVAGFAAKSDVVANVEPLRPALTEEGELLGKELSNPFVSSAARLEPDSEWDDSFEAFAAGRLQSPKDLNPDRQAQQDGRRPREQCNNEAASPLVADADRGTRVNDAPSLDIPLNRCTESRVKAHDGVSVVTDVHHFNTFAQYLDPIPEDRSFEYDSKMLTASADSPKSDPCTETYQANGATNSNMHQAPFHTSQKPNSTSPDAGSSGLGSSAEDDFLSCLSSYSASDKFSASSSDDVEAQTFESNTLGFEISSDLTVLENRKQSESDDDIADRSNELPLVDVAQQTAEKAELNWLEGSLEPQSPVFTHQQPMVPTEKMGNEDAHAQTPNLSSVATTDVSPESGLKPNSNVSLQFDGENGERVQGEFSRSPEKSDDFSASDVVSTLTDDELGSTHPSVHIITSSPDAGRRLSDSPFESTSFGGRDASRESPPAFGLLGEFLDASRITPTQMSDQGSLLQSLYVTTDSQHYQSCQSHPSPSISEPEAERLHSANSTLCDEPGEIQTPSGAVLGIEDSPGAFTPSRGGMDQTVWFEESRKAEDGTATPQPGLTIGPRFLSTPDEFHTSCKLTRGEGVAASRRTFFDDMSVKFPSSECPSLHRSQSEGTLSTAFDKLLPSFGSDSCALQELSSALPGPDLPPPTHFAPSLTPESSCFPLALYALSSLSDTSARSPPSMAKGAAPVLANAMPQEAQQQQWRRRRQQQQQATNQQNSPHPVKPLTTATPAEEKRTEGRSVLATGLEKLKSTIQAGRSGQLSEPETDRRKSLTEGAGSYYHLTHSELVALLVQREAELERQKAEFQQQKALLAKREVELRRLKPQVRDLEDYIDTLLVRIMEQKPTLLQVRSKLK